MSHKRNHKCKDSTTTPSCTTDSSCSFSTKTDCSSTKTCSSSSTCCPSSTSTCSTTSGCSTSTNTTCCPSTCETSSCSTTNPCSSSTSCSSLTQTCCSSSSSCSSSESSTEGSEFSEGSCCPQDVEVLGKKKFKVTFGKKHGHRHENLNCDDTAIYINGQLAPVLKLQRGYEYYFSVKQNECSKHKNYFVLTENPVGKIGDKQPIPLKNSFDPISCGCAKIFVDCCTTKYFYYQNANGSFQGNLVLVTDGCC